jgi:hypothetical protein
MLIIFLKILKMEFDEQTLIDETYNEKYNSER